ncbi:MAG: Rieske 2Fe-2S domain-containing protein [Myxococcales bacterium]|nr:Rieske 2Fe-2S domain-containing protein [Myxococcales bacterium]
MGNAAGDHQHIDLHLGQLQNLNTTVFEFQAGGVVVEGFVYRDGDRLVAYLNRCAHVPYPLDFADGKFLSRDNKTFECQSHGARYNLWTGACVRGPCKDRKLISIPLVILNNNVVRLFTGGIDENRLPPAQDESQPVDDVDKVSGIR